MNLFLEGRCHAPPFRLALRFRSSQLTQAPIRTWAVNGVKMFDMNPPPGGEARPAHVTLTFASETP